MASSAPLQSLLRQKLAQGKLSAEEFNHLSRVPLPEDIPDRLPSSNKATMQQPRSRSADLPSFRLRNIDSGHHMRMMSSEFARFLEENERKLSTFSSPQPAGQSAPRRISGGGNGGRGGRRDGRRKRGAAARREVAQSVFGRSTGHSRARAPSSFQFRRRRAHTTQGPSWQADTSAPTCLCCGDEFGLLSKRRHHCRACGDVVCHSCSCRFLALPEFGYGKTPTRCCWRCHVFLGQNPLPRGSVGDEERHAGRRKTPGNARLSSRRPDETKDAIDGRRRRMLLARQNGQQQQGAASAPHLRMAPPESVNVTCGVMGMGWSGQANGSSSSGATAAAAAAAAAASALHEAKAPAHASSPEQWQRRARAHSSSPRGSPTRRAPEPLDVDGVIAASWVARTGGHSRVLGRFGPTEYCMLRLLEESELRRHHALLLRMLHGCHRMRLCALLPRLRQEMRNDGLSADDVDGEDAAASSFSGTSHNGTLSSSWSFRGVRSERREQTHETKLRAGRPQSGGDRGGGSDDGDGHGRGVVVGGESNASHQEDRMWRQLETRILASRERANVVERHFKEQRFVCVTPEPGAFFMLETVVPFRISTHFHGLGHGHGSSIGVGATANPGRINQALAACLLASESSPGLLWRRVVVPAKGALHWGPHSISRLVDGGGSGAAEVGSTGSSSGSGSGSTSSNSSSVSAALAAAKAARAARSESRVVHACARIIVPSGVHLYAGLRKGAGGAKAKANAGAEAGDDDVVVFVPHAVASALFDAAHSWLVLSGGAAAARINRHAYELFAKHQCGAAFRAQEAALVQLQAQRAVRQKEAALNAIALLQSEAFVDASGQVRRMAKGRLLHHRPTTMSASSPSPPPPPPPSWHAAGQHGHGRGQQQRRQGKGKHGKKKGDSSPGTSRRGEKVALAKYAAARHRREEKQRKREAMQEQRLEEYAYTYPHQPQHRPGGTAGIGDGKGNDAQGEGLAARRRGSGTVLAGVLAQPCVCGNLVFPSGRETCVGCGRPVVSLLSTVSEEEEE